MTYKLKSDPSSPGWNRSTGDRVPWQRQLVVSVQALGLNLHRTHARRGAVGPPDRPPGCPADAAIPFRAPARPPRGARGYDYPAAMAPRCDRLEVRGWTLCPAGPGQSRVLWPLPGGVTACGVAG